MTRLVVSVSGGKDSTATALLALAHAREHADTVCDFVFADTGNEHELTYAYLRDYLPTVLGQRITELKADFTERIAGKRRHVETHWPAKGVPQADIARALAALHPTGVPFLDLCLWKGRFPSRMAQFCTQELKRYPLDAYLLEHLAGGPVESWRGVRRDESRNRATAQLREPTAEGWVTVQPIVTWSAMDVVTYVRGHGVELNPLYTQGMTRVGCMPCINISKDELAAIAQRFPQHIDRIREWEWLISQASKRGFSTFFGQRGDGDTDAMIFDRGQIDARVQWALTSHGGRQYTFLKVLDAEEPCSSTYGLCE